MFTVYKKEIEWGGKSLILETGRMARQADGAVLATYGETQVLATVCYAKTQKEDMGFFPLTCLYQEKFYAAGRIPGSFFKREGRPTEKETLTSRLMDRPIRPLFDKRFQNETQVVANVLQSDGENDPDVVAMVAASAALALSGAPFLAPIAAARVGYQDGEYFLNPTHAERKEQALDLVMAGTREGVLMVESEASELSEEIMLGAVNFGHKACEKVIAAIEELAEAAAKPAMELPEVEDTSALEADLTKAFGAKITEAYKIKGKQDRSNALDAIKEEAKAEFVKDTGDAEADTAQANRVKKLMKGLEGTALRGDVLANKIRIDGRTPSDIRPIVAEVDTLPRTHGSSLFTRGETQALVVATLGTALDEQIMDELDGEWRSKFMLHYNFPPFSVGEVRRMGGPGRREIGHGKLAQRSLNRLMPKHDDFPYTIRLVSEVLESNGSSSMATVCGSSMSLMAAGVPLPRPVAGIAMGLVKENDAYVVLSDIMGDEDHLGDMDFKVAGTSEGITALQMDIKITSITPAIMEEALAQAKDGRLHILEKMAKAITTTRSDISDFAPAMKNIQLPSEKIREVIGKGGETIRGLCDEFGVTINIDDDGLCVVAGVERPQVDACLTKITTMIAEPEIGTIYEGNVVKTVDFGAFVAFMGGKEGLVHISEVADVRVGHITDIMNEGDAVNVQVTDLDDRGKLRLTLKGVEQPADIAKRIAEIEAAGGSAKPEGDRDRDRKGGRGDKRDGDRGNRGGDRSGDRGGNKRAPRRS